MRLRRGGVRCDIRQRDWRPPPKPRSCELDWGFGLTLDRRGRGQFVCAGDTVSRERAMRCVNRRNGHGFALSKQFARRF